MGLPFPPRQRRPVHYFPIFATVLMLVSIISICIWIHYTQLVIYSIRGALDVVDTTATADNYYVLSQSVVATSVLFMIYACVIFGLCLWRALLEAEIDQLGEIKDKLQLYQMANLGVRICWFAIMTWIVLLMAGCAILGVYVSNMAYLVKYTLRNQDLVAAPARKGAYPDCPATCVDLWVVDYINVPMQISCICDSATLHAILDHLHNALGGMPGCITGVMIMYVVGGFWRSELSKQHAAVRTEQDVAARLAAGSSLHGGAGGLEAGLGRQPLGGNGYRALPAAPGSGRGGGRTGPGRGRGRGKEPG